MSHVLRYAARTDRGLLRANNQDSVYAGDRLLIIADGMGGHAAGDVASRLVVAAFMPLDELALGTDMRRPLIDATHEGNAAIAEMVDENPEFDGMGTTLTALLFDGPQVALAHVGDSRAYLYRDGVMHQISHDDTFVQSLVDDGRITSDEAAHHPQRSLLLRALNGSDMDPTITLREISPGDRFLICSDGLSDYVSPESIADALLGADPDQVADTLIQLALVAGGPDNVTVIVADVIETGAPPPSPATLAAAADPEATGPMQAIQETQKFPRVPLPGIPEEPAAKPDFVSESESDADDLDDGLDDDGLDDDRLDDHRLDDHRLDDDRPDGRGLDDRGTARGRPDNAADLRERRAMVGAPPRRRGRRSAFAFALVVLIAVALSGTYLWARSKYYVGEDGGQVVVFRGVDGSLLGLRFASVQENSCTVDNEPGCPMQVTDLQQDARDQVGAGIAVGSLTEARGVISRLLTDKRLPLCSDPTGPIEPTGTGPQSPPSGTPSSVLTDSSGLPSLSSQVSASNEISTRPTGASATQSAGSRSTTPSLGGGPSTVTLGAGPVTTTVVVTVTADAAGPADGPGASGHPSDSNPSSDSNSSTDSSSGQRLRLAPVPTSRPPATSRPPVTSRAGPPRSTQRATEPSVKTSGTIPTPTITVTSTFTVTPSPTSGSSSAAISLTPQTQEPGVNCRSPR